ncbi:MAG: YjcQ family protein [Clostridium sp.]|nr:YjcQ family protein [Clostridium sp.]
MRNDNFQIIIEILDALESQLDNEPGNLNWRMFAPETLGVSVERWSRIITMLEEEKLVKGFSFTVEKGKIINNSRDPRITLKGLRYLKEEG